ncbi:MAG: integrase, partial [Devosia sp.]
MTDNLALSFVLLIMEKMARNLDASTENDPQHGSARPQRTPIPVGISSALAGDVEMVENDDPRAEAPFPAPHNASAVPAHLEALADRAREYVEAASAPNTRRAYDSDWKHFGSWCRRQGLDQLLPDPQIVGLYITA